MECYWKLSWNEPKKAFMAKLTAQQLCMCLKFVYVGYSLNQTSL